SRSLVSTPLLLCGAASALPARRWSAGHRVHRCPPQPGGPSRAGPPCGCPDPSRHVRSDGRWCGPRARPARGARPGTYVVLALLVVLLRARIISLASGTPRNRGQLTFTVRAVGTAVVHNVEVRAPGSLRCAPKSDSTMFQASMGVGSEPIVFDVWFSEKAESKVYIEIIWTRLRPYRAYGERVEVESLAWEEWRWHWGRVCLRRRPGGKWWTARPVRTSGGWVPMGGRARAEIPR